MENEIILNSELQDKETALWLDTGKISPLEPRAKEFLSRIWSQYGTWPRPLSQLFEKEEPLGAQIKTNEKNALNLTVDVTTGFFSQTSHKYTKLTPQYLEKFALPGFNQLIAKQLQKKHSLEYPDIAKNIAYLSSVISVISTEVAARGRQLIITSGYRPTFYNQKIGGAANSHHRNGMAADMQTTNNDPTWLYSLIEQLINEGNIPDGELIIYNTFVHFAPVGSKKRINNRK